MIGGRKLLETLKQDGEDPEHHCFRLGLETVASGLSFCVSFCGPVRKPCP